MELSKSELAAQAEPTGAQAWPAAPIAEIVAPSSVVRIMDVEDEGP